MQNQLVIVKMSNAYDGQDFYKDAKEKGWEPAVIDAQAIPGTDCYCDGKAVAELRRLLGAYSPEGLRFLDSGNYHYLSLLWLEKIKEPFALVLLDHHPDMQRPAFGDITSCGGWVVEALQRIPQLRRVYLYGVDEMLLEECREEAPYVQERVEVCSWDNLPETKLPLYVSCDKDVMSREAACCDWDQGEASLGQVLGLLARIRRECALIGVDVCGECCRRRSSEADEINNRTNAAVIDLFSKWM